MSAPAASQFGSYATLKQRQVLLNIRSVYDLRIVIVNSLSILIY